jgi:hypothetical protein
MPSRRDPRTRGRPPPDRPSVTFKREKAAIEQHVKGAKIVLSPNSREYFFAKKKTMPPPQTPDSSYDMYLVARQNADKLLSSPGYLTWVGCGAGRLLKQALQPLKEVTTAPKLKDLWKRKYIAEIERQEKAKTMKITTATQTEPITDHSYARDPAELADKQKEADKKSPEDKEMTDAELLTNIDNFLYGSDSERQEVDKPTVENQIQQEEDSEEENALVIEEDALSFTSPSSPSPPSSSSPSPPSSPPPIPKLQKALAINSALDQLMRFLVDCEQTLDGPERETTQERRLRMNREENEKLWTEEDEKEMMRANQMARFFFKRYLATMADTDFDMGNANLTRYLERKRSKSKRRKE